MGRLSLTGDGGYVTQGEAGKWRHAHMHYHNDSRRCSPQLHGPFFSPQLRAFLYSTSSCSVLWQAKDWGQLVGGQLSPELWEGLYR
jgi:hypothetical protein